MTTLASICRHAMSNLDIGVDRDNTTAPEHRTMTKLGNGGDWDTTAPQHLTFSI